MHLQVHVGFNRPLATPRRKVVSGGLLRKDEGHLEHVFEKFHVVRCEVAMHKVYLCKHLNDLSAERHKMVCKCA
jgi:hypothetical protein